MILQHLLYNVLRVSFKRSNYLQFAFRETVSQRKPSIWGHCHNISGVTALRPTVSYVWKLGRPGFWGHIVAGSPRSMWCRTEREIGPGCREGRWSRHQEMTRRWRELNFSSTPGCLGESHLLSVCRDWIGGEREGEIVTTSFFSSDVWETWEWEIYLPVNWSTSTGLSVRAN